VREVLADASGGAVLLDTPTVRALSPAARDLLRRLLEADPALRITAAEALRHAFLEEQGFGPAAAAAATAATAA